MPTVNLRVILASNAVGTGLCVSVRTEAGMIIVVDPGDMQAVVDTANEKEWQYTTEHGIIDFAGASVGLSR